LLGPLPNGEKSGGVAVFTQNLAIQLKKDGHEVVVFSKDVRSTSLKDKIEVRSLKELSKSIKRNQPQLIISSLWYSIFMITHKRIVTVYLLHGFTNIRDYSKIKFIGMIIFDAIVRSKVNFVLANSSFTRFINENIYNLKVNGEFHIGLPHSEILALKNDIPKKNDVLYLGRLVKAKNVDLIESSFIKAFPVENTQLNILGYGPELEHITDIAKKQDRIEILGPIENTLVPKYFRESKVFVSLNPTEPFGITYLEALIANCFIVAPETGGQVELLRRFPDRVKLVNIHNQEEIVNALKFGMACKFKKFADAYDIENFTYKKTVNDILQVVLND